MTTTIIDTISARPVGGEFFAQARENGGKVYLKPNLLGDTNAQSLGMQLSHAEPDRAIRTRGGA
jgi:hypothetical protein